MNVSKLLQTPYTKYLKQVKQNEQIQIEITGFENNTISSDLYGFNDKSPAIRWSPVENAASYAIALVDYDATSNEKYASPFVHWFAVNIFEPQINFNASNDGYAVLYQGETSASPYFKDSLIENHKQLDHKYFVAPFPPNKEHKYEFKVYALKHKINNNRDNLFYFGDFEKMIDEAVVIGQGVKYFNVPKLSVINDEVVADLEDFNNKRLFKNEDGSYHVIEDVEIQELQKNTFTKDSFINFDENQQPKIKITDSSDAIAYAVVVLSSHHYQEFGSLVVNYAHIVDKKTNKRLKFNNGYETNKKIASYFNLNTSDFKKELLVLNEEKLSPGRYTILVYGLDVGVDELNIPQQRDLSTLYESISEHVIAYTSKFIK